MPALHNLTALNFLAVGVGAAFGAWVRWLLGVALNPLFIAVPLGLASMHLAGSLTATWLGLLTVGATRIWS